MKNKIIRKKYLGIVEYTLNGLLHREDGPALIYPRSSLFWYKHGKMHRTDGPAAIWASGTMTWFKNGKEVKPF